MKRQIPENSDASVKNGIWLIHQDEDNVIQLWSSTLTGNEKIYLNNNLVSEKRSYKKNSHHSFKDSDQNEYRVQYRTIHRRHGPIECVVFKNDVEIRKFKIQYIRNSNLKPILMYFLILILILIPLGIILQLLTKMGYFEKELGPLFLLALALVLLYFRLPDLLYGSMSFEITQT